MTVDLNSFSDLVSRPFIGGYASNGGIIDTALASADYVPAAPIRGLICEGTGNLKVTMVDGTVQQFNTVPDYYELRGFMISRVWKTGTTATRIHPLI